MTDCVYLSPYVPKIVSPTLSVTLTLQRRTTIEPRTKQRNWKR